MLDIGCGRGEALKYAIEHGAEEVVGIDFSEDAVAITRDYLKQFNLAGTIYCADATEQVQQWSASTPTPVFDIVIMFDCVEHIPRKELSVLLTFLHKLLCPCGIVAVNTPVYLCGQRCAC